MLPPEGLNVFCASCVEPSYGVQSSFIERHGLLEVAVKAYRSDTIDAIDDPVRSGCLEFLHYIGVLKSPTSISDKPCITTRRAGNTNLIVDDNISAKCHELCVVLG